MNDPAPPYLNPYLRAAQRHGGRFESLLWASPQTQQARFDALARLCDFRGLQVLDVGCGRADLLDYLLERNLRPAHYVGIDAVDEFVQAARSKPHEDCQIVQADFLREPHRLLVGADAMVFCGSLNTLSTVDFYRMLHDGFQAASDAVLFNFLCSPRLASASWLSWHERDDVLEFARRLTPDVVFLADYMDGDCTMAMRKHHREGKTP
jgi:SAM-dependent methyltransferase